MKPLLLGLAVAAFVAAPLAAQTDPHQPSNDGSAAASATVPPGGVAPGLDPGTTFANSGPAAALAQSSASAQAQYQSDLADYDAAVRAHGAQVARQDAHYARQQRAFADAMAAWRVQVAACQKGKRLACKAPAPDPADFY